METIVAIDLGKYKSVFCEMDRGSLKTQYRTVRTRPEVFHGVFAELDAKDSIVLFEIGNQAGWLSDMLRGMELDFKVANTNDPAWKWTNNPVKSDKKTLCDWQRCIIRASFRRSICPARWFVKSVC